MCGLSSIFLSIKIEEGRISLGHRIKLYIYNYIFNSTSGDNPNLVNSDFILFCSAEEKSITTFMSIFFNAFTTIFLSHLWRFFLCHLRVIFLCHLWGIFYAILGDFLMEFNTKFCMSSIFLCHL